MKHFFKRILSILVLVFTITNLTYANLTLKDFVDKELDVSGTFADFTKVPFSILDGKLVVLGDSYAFLLSAYSNYQFNYIVHQGYTVKQINNEFVDKIPKDSFKYAYMFIGPNDFMNQTDLFSFKKNLQEIILKLKSNGMQVIFSNYFDPDYSTETSKTFTFYGIPCYQYDYIIKDLVISNNLIYVDILDLLSKYGRMEYDYVHPHENMYTPVIERIIEHIKYYEKTNVN